MWLFPPQTRFPLCTLAETPRTPAHCIEYVHLIQWGRDRGGEAFDADEPEHMQWVFTQAAARAQSFGIAGVTLQLTQGVVKNIVPAIASTNAIVAAMCAQECLKLVSMCSKGLDNYIMYMGGQGLYTHTVSYERDPSCPSCSPGVPVKVPAGTSLEAFMAAVEQVEPFKGKVQAAERLLRVAAALRPGPSGSHDEAEPAEAHGGAPGGGVGHGERHGQEAGCSGAGGGHRGVRARRSRGGVRGLKTLSPSCDPTRSDGVIHHNAPLPGVVCGHSLLGDGRQLLPVVGELHPPDDAARIPVTLPRLHCLDAAARVPLPQPHRTIAGAGGEVRPVRSEGHVGGHVVVSVQGGHQVRVLGIEDAEPLVVAGRHQVPAVGGEGERPDRAVVALLQHVQQLLGLGVEDGHARARSGERDLGAVGAHGHRHGEPLLPLAVRHPRPSGKGVSAHFLGRAAQGPDGRLRCRPPRHAQALGPGGVGGEADPPGLRRGELQGGAGLHGLPVPHPHQRVQGAAGPEVAPGVHGEGRHPQLVPALGVPQGERVPAARRAPGPHALV
eukprot:CAMPEP_0119151880 /NCGR_PEP_ID=MMETSP1310-20130426/46949_1 /TAXON_ID=464262 /ORGANISM="Genus nov. species nov., Strain RCC2339" /LENGTH=553 /DNA_ID=CAMNT_0007144195 /DNA_START=38 /DNA_END=1695 /DNA_ORIENTATION=-